MGMFATKKTAFPKEKVDELFSMVPLETGAPPAQPTFGGGSQGNDPYTLSLGGGMGETVNPEAQHKSKGFFGSDGMGKALLGGLFDSILSQTGGQPVFMPSMLRKQQLADQDVRDQRKRANEFADFTKQWDYQAKNPKPVNNDTSADYSFWQSRLTPEEFEQWKANKINPPRLVQWPDGSMRMVGGATPTPKATPQVGEVRGGYRYKGGDPAAEANWEPTGGTR